MTGRQLKLSQGAFTALCLALAVLPAGAQYGGQPSQSPGGGNTAYPAFQGQPSSLPAARQAQGRVPQWFARYDDIRRRAQMNPAERQEADILLSRGMSIIMPGPDKMAARDLLIRLVQRYEIAASAMRQLPMIDETAELHRGYYQYFSTARQLFADYLRVQDNVFAADPATGQPVAGLLVQRKEALEQLNQRIQALDSWTRGQFGIQPYRQ